MSRLAFSTLLLFGSIFLPSTSLAQDASSAQDLDAVHPLLFQASMGIGSAGGEGRWGIVLERHPGRGLGIGFGGGAGFAVIGDSTVRGGRGAWIAPVLRPGYFFGMRKELRVSGCFGAGLVPMVDILEDGSTRWTVAAQPGFLISVQRFAFGLGMQVGGTPLATGKRDERGASVGVVTHLGAAL